jgi:hypothetical protein
MAARPLEIANLGWLNARRHVGAAKASERANLADSIRRVSSYGGGKSRLPPREEAPRGLLTVGRIVTGKESFVVTLISIGTRSSPIVP